MKVWALLLTLTLCLVVVSSLQIQESDRAKGKKPKPKPSKGKTKPKPSKGPKPKPAGKGSGASKPGGNGSGGKGSGSESGSSIGDQWQKVWELFEKLKGILLGLQQSGSGSGGSGSGSGTGSGSGSGSGVPPPAPTGGSEYIPGTPGGPWTDEEISIVREKIFQFMDTQPENIDGLFNEYVDKETDPTYRNKLGYVSEGTLLRLSFHDCFRYSDGSGGCDGCLNWKNMGWRIKSFANNWVPDEEKTPLLSYPPVQETDNNGLDRVVYYLEKVYTSTDWPPTPRNLTASLKASGKSRADLWQFAGNVALEKLIERSNYACKVDYNQRQQTTLLEGLLKGYDLEYGIWKCNIKLTKPFKFKFGRKDCIPSPDLEYPYIATKEEVQPMAFGTADSVLQFMKKEFDMSARDFIALTSIHSIVAHPNPNTVGTKYSWFGNSYLTNMYYKMLANKPTYAFNWGSDIGFCCGDDPTGGVRILPHSVGDKDGNPVAMWAWRVTCNDAWNTTDHGPCVMRPVRPDHEGAIMQSETSWDCYGGIDANGNIKLNENLAKFGACKNAYFTKEGIQKGGKPNGNMAGASFNNQFGLPYEVGLYYKFDVKPDTKRATGCPGINAKYEDFPWKTDGAKWGWFKSSNPMNCSRNEYAPEGQPVHEIVEEYADDHDVWASDFLDAWQRMQANGYEYLWDAPDSSWLGYHSLSKNNTNFGDGFEDYIEKNAPVVLPMFSDPEPNICGHSGGFNKRCKWTFSDTFKRNPDDERNDPEDTQEENEFMD